MNKQIVKKAAALGIIAVKFKRLEAAWRCGVQ